MGWDSTKAWEKIYRDRARLGGSWMGTEGGYASVYLTSKSVWELLNQHGVFEEGEDEEEGMS